MMCAFYNSVRIVGTPWHIPHQYYLARLPFVRAYDLVMSPYRAWNKTARPLPENVTEVTCISPSVHYDAAILHIDQETPHSRRKLTTFCHMKEATDHIKVRVVINHGVPVSDNSDKATISKSVADLVGDIPMISNSRQAAAEWGWGGYIQHAYPPGEFYRGEGFRAGVLAFVSPNGMENMYQRHRLSAVAETLWLQYRIKLSILGHEGTRPQSYNEYRELLSKSLIYLHLSDHSPMPRTRTEAMLSGMHIITTPGHGFDQLFGGLVDVVDGDDADGISSLINQRCMDPSDTMERAYIASKSASIQMPWVDYCSAWRALLI